MRAYSLAVSRRSALFSSNPDHQINVRDGYKWNIIIKGLQEEGKPGQAAMVFAEMGRKGLKVDSYTLLFVLRSCSAIPWLSGGAVTHGQIFKMGFESEVITQTALLQMYGCTENLEYAKKVFDETPEKDLAVWNAIIKTYARGSQPHRALGLLCDMGRDSLWPNGLTAVSVISACSPLRSPKIGKLLHGFFMKVLVYFDLLVYNSLIDMHMKSGCQSVARKVFDQMPARNVITWTTMLNGYRDNNNPQEALALFRKMESENVRPDEITVLGLVSLFSKLGRFDLAELVDGYIKKNGYDTTITMSNALIDMYAKCGNIERPCQIFDKMVNRNLVTWTTMIQGLALHGQGVSALVRFCQMQREGFKPDEIVFISILSACCHAGFVDEARKCFRSMIEDHGITPWMDHYGCMVDLLCRAGLANEAFDFVESMPTEPDEKIWRTLIRVCNTGEHIARAKQVMTHLLELEPKYSGNYVLLSNLYASNGEWSNAKEIRKGMGIRGAIKKDPGHSLVLVKRQSSV